MPPTLVDADPEAGFHYPYYLHVPEETGPSAILVEPTSSAEPSDDFSDHLAQAERRVGDATGRTIADELSVPFLHPVFPRPVSQPVDWTHYTHSLDVETLTIKEGPLERIDLQLLAMVDDARTQLAERGRPVGEEFLLNGFSSSGTFANRFAALHPERVLAVSAGGVNGMAILPVEHATELPVDIDVDLASLLGPLPYPVGVGDLAELTGAPFDSAAFRGVHQFLYMGGDDANDSLRYPDAWTGPEVRAAAILAYGEDIHDERFPRCRTVYEELEVPAVFRVYPGVGHRPGPAVDDIVAFHERTLAGEGIDAIRRDLEGDQR